MVLEGHTQKSTHRSVSSDDDRRSIEPVSRHHTTTRYTLLTVALPHAPDAGTGLAGVRRGRRCEVTFAYVTGDVGETAGLDPRAEDPPSDAVVWSWWLDGQPVELTVRRFAVAGVRNGAISWRAAGVLRLPVASGTAPVSVDVAAFDMDDVLQRWTTVDVEILMDRRSAWLADIYPRR
jgi:hypothetical protein